MFSPRVLPTVALLMLTASLAQAHFLFVRILPPAEGGRAAEVYFSELAQAGDPRFVDKIAQTQLWMQQTPGMFTSLAAHKAPDRLRAWVPVSGSLVVVGHCDYGVLARPQQTAFLLRHFPKALAGNPEELNRLKAHGKLPLEVTTTIEGDEIHFVALKDGKPHPALQAALADKLPARRGAAGEALVKGGGPEDRLQAKKLLADADSLVRLRVGLALAYAKEREAVPALIDVLAQVPLQHAWLAEDVLYRLADGVDPPKVSLGNNDDARARCRDAWRDW